MLNIVKLASKKYTDSTKANVKLIEKRYFDVEYEKQHEWKKTTFYVPFNFEWKIWILYVYTITDKLFYKLQKSKKFIENFNEYNMYSKWDRN